jgi:hypothetical protein
MRQPPPTFSATWKPPLHWPRYRVRTSITHPIGSGPWGPLSTEAKMGADSDDACAEEEERELFMSLSLSGVPGCSGWGPVIVDPETQPRA